MFDCMTFRKTPYFLLFILLLAGCTENIQEKNEFNETQNDQNQDKVSDNLQLNEAEPYLEKIALNNMDLRKKAFEIVSACPLADKECQVNTIYRYIVENYKYRSDPQRDELIQSPKETISFGGGDCEDFAILLNSLLENLGIKTYLVLTEDHAYSLACGIETDKLWAYINQSYGNQLAKDLDENSSDITFTFDQKNGLTFTIEKNQSFTLNSNYFQFFGGNGEALTDRRLNIKYEINSSQPLNIEFVSTQEEYNKMIQGKTYNHYPSCEQKNILTISETCENLGNYGGIVLQNNTNKTATISLKLQYQFRYLTASLPETSEITYYSLDNQKCIILDATEGKYGYAGLANDVTGKKFAFDSTTKKIVPLD